MSTVISQMVDIDYKLMYSKHNREDDMSNNLLLRIRKKLGVSQIRMGEWLGVSGAAVSAYERNRKSPYKHLGRILELALIAGVDVTLEEIDSMQRVRKRHE